MARWEGAGAMRSATPRVVALWANLLMLAVATLSEGGAEPAEQGATEQQRSCVASRDAQNMTQLALPLTQAERTAAMDMYLRTCELYKIRPSADVMNRVELGSHDFIVVPSADSPFGDLELRAMVVLLGSDGGRLLHDVRSLDLSRCTLGPSSMLLLADMIRRPACCLQTLDLSNQAVGPEGIRALAHAIRYSRVMEKLVMYSVGLGDDGGHAVLDMLRDASSNGTNSLQLVDIQNNYISPRTCNGLVSVAADAGITLNIAGNRVYDEVLNSVTHGLGEVLAIGATVLLVLKVRHRPAYFWWPTIAYAASMNVLYIASTLFHAFFALGQVTLYIFGVLDYSGIFILIAGSYSPFLGVLFPDECWARWMLRGMWGTAVFGTLTVAFYRGPGQNHIRLTLFLTMGWSCAFCVNRIINKIGTHGTALLIGGGVLYTAGVPFFVRDLHTLGFPDHSIWHIFVVCASACHFVCIYYHVLDNGYPSATKGGDMHMSGLPLLMANGNLQEDSGFKGPGSGWQEGKEDSSIASHSGSE